MRPSSVAPASPRSPFDARDLLLKVVAWSMVPLTVISVVMFYQLGSNLTTVRQTQEQAVRQALAAPALSARLPALTGMEREHREHRFDLFELRFANGRRALVNPSYRWVYVSLPTAQWATAVALQREAERRIQAGETHAEAYHPPVSVPTLDAAAAQAWRNDPSARPVAWNPPEADCPWCSTTVLADGTRLTVDPAARTVHLALPFSMLPDALALPDPASRADD